MNKRLTLFVWAIVLVPLMAFSQGTIKGTVTDAATGEALPGANVIVDGQPYGGASDLSGAYAIEGIPVGTYTITASVIGYEKASQTVAVAAGLTVTVNFNLSQAAIMGSALEVLASRATRETPVAFTNVDKSQMSLRLGSRDIPLVLNTTPSVYATEGGGGAGDARINVRGFNQRNVAIMINGVPVNDMENGWVYWSNWDGVGDATSSIQVQRGLSAVNLATPSVGGTMNIITDPAAQGKSAMVKKEIGSWGFSKSTVAFSTGNMDGLAINGAVVRKTGIGFYDATWTDAWAYYLGAGYAMNSNNRFEFYAVGAPQRHGQNLYKQNVARYSQQYAKEIFADSVIALDADSNGVSDVFEKYKELGRAFNQTSHGVSTSYDGLQYWDMYGEQDGITRYSPTLLNERENFYHKPQLNLNWYLNLSDQMRLSTILYWSGGSGGGTGTYGSVVTNYNEGGYRDWDAEIAQNTGNIDATYSNSLSRATGILRNSRNNQSTIGLISKLNVDVSNSLKTIVGVDWRTAEINHYYDVRDLLGGDYYVFEGNEFDTTQAMQMKFLGDKLNYYNTNTVNWLGFFGQAEFKSGPISAYGTAGYSTTGYTYTDHFKASEEMMVIVAGDTSYVPDPSSKPLHSENKGLSGYQIKGGGMYRLTEDLGVFANLGYISKAPIFDNAINDYDGSVNKNVENELFNSFEVGLDASGLGGIVAAKANYYNTKWLNRSNLIGYTLPDGSDATLFLAGMDANHSGIEAEVGLRPISLLRLDFAASFGDWKYTKDVTGIYNTWVDTTFLQTGTYIETQDTATYYVKDLKVGDSPQTQYSISASLYPTQGMSLQAVMRFYANNYADWDPFTRTTLEEDASGNRVQSWMAPDYSVVDLHASYDLPINTKGMKFTVFAHVFNALDNVYVIDAVDNSKYNAFTGDGKNHAADDAEVYLGQPRHLNMGVTMRF